MIYLGYDSIHFFHSFVLLRKFLCVEQICHEGDESKNANSYYSRRAYNLNSKTDFATVENKYQI